MKYNNMMKDIFDEVVDNDAENVFDFMVTNRSVKNLLQEGWELIHAPYDNEYYVFTCFNSELNQQANWYIPYSVPVEEAEKTIIEKCSVFVR